MGLALGTLKGRTSSMESVMILGIETSVEHVGVALGDHRGIRAEMSLSSDRRHAESLTPMIQFVMSQAEASMSDLSAIAVDVGPGLFTGMRVGIATAESMAWALDLRIAPVCSLDALALNADWSEVPVLAALDARRGEVYWSMYRMRGAGQSPQRLTEPAVSHPDDVAIHIADRADDVVCVGSGITRYVDTFSAVPRAMVVSHHDTPRASAVVTLAMAALVDDTTVMPHAVEPMYLRAPDAEINWKTREGSQ